jgi:VacB/RNase II family 3'-5' exoribonuclease
MTTHSNGLEQLRSIARQAMIERGLEPDFSPAALLELSAISQPARDSGPQIRDRRSLLWASIDNDDSRDLDQLSVADGTAAGAMKVLVAVADVDAVVRRGSAIDAHARTNTTSVYTAAQVFPMLPEKLSTDLTSLGQHQERLSIVVEMTVADDGRIGESQIYRARVVNRAKLAYRTVAAWLEGNAPPPAPLAAVPGLEDNLRLQDRIAQALKRARHERGALNLQTLEPRAVLSDGVLTDLQAEAKNRAEELIEELMIAANGVVARYLEQRQVPAIRRVLRTPERWDRIVAVAAQRGGRLPSAPDARALNSFLAQQQDADPAGFPDLSLAVIKLLGAGEYVLEVPGKPIQGHFGLAVRDYTHSTAPNRRYPDLITQRLLKAALAGSSLPYSEPELQALAAHCTEQEGNAAKVERQVRKSAAAQLLTSRIGERFAAIVTGASDKGTWVRTLQPLVEGRLTRGYEGLDVGDQLTVELLHTDIGRGYIDFARSQDRTAHDR